MLPKMVGSVIKIKACERSGHSGVCIGLGTWEALPPRDRCQLDNSGPDSPEHYVYTWMIKLEIAGCLQNAAQMKVFVGRCRGWQTAFMLDRGSVFCLPSSDRMYHQADVEVDDIQPSTP